MAGYGCPGDGRGRHLPASPSSLPHPGVVLSRLHVAGAPGFHPGSSISPAEGVGWGLGGLGGGGGWWDPGWGCRCAHWRWADDGFPKPSSCDSRQDGDARLPRQLMPAHTL